MGVDGLKVGVQIRNFMINTTRICYRSVCNHPFVMGILFMMLILYRLSPFLFSFFVSASPVLVCTAVLLGTLLSFCEPEVLAEEKTDLLLNVSDEQPLVDSTDELKKSEKTRADVGFSSMDSGHNSREIHFEIKPIDEEKSVTENKTAQKILDFGDQMFRMGVDFRLSHLAEKVRYEEDEECKSVKGSIIAHMGESQNHENFEDYKSAEGSLDVQIGDQLEPSLASWKQFDGLDDTMSPSKFEDYELGEESSEVQLGNYLESSPRSWKPLDSDHVESDSGSDGAESSSPDASMADILPMLDDLHPLLDDEMPQACNLSRHSSIASIETSVKLFERSIHSEDESYHKEEEAPDCKSDDENEEESQGIKDYSGKSAIMWTEDDQKNLMDLGTSELERNQRLESLIARRRARKMMADKNLIDFDGMDLPFPVAPIATRRGNPFDLPHESYDDLGLPPVPGSAPSIMLNRRNPFDLPYDSSEEKPDLTGDSFQQEFTEITQKEAFNQREAIFRRNETFSMGSSAFDFARPSRFRPYFVPERIDSDGMSYSSFQRQFSELSESKASSVAETESISVTADQEEKKQIELDVAQEAEPNFEIDQASVLVEHGSQSSEDLVETGKSADNRLSFKEVSRATESWLSHSEGSHSNIHLMEEFIDLKHNNTSSKLSVPNVPNEQKLEDVDSCLVNKEHNQCNDVMNVEIPTRCFVEPVVSDVTMKQDASDVCHAIEVEKNHRKEPLYDLSPLTKNHSLSSSSDMQRETSGIDLSHLSRDLFLVDESSVHNEEAKNKSEPTRQDAGGNSLTVGDVGEGGMLGSAEPLSEFKQLPENSQPSMVAEDESRLNIDSSDREFKDILDSKVSSNEVQQIFAKRDDAETQVERKLDAYRSADNLPASGGGEFVEDFILAEEKREVALSADDVSGLLFPLDEHPFFPHRSDMYDPWADLAKQESSTLNTKLKEVDQLDKVNEPVNLLVFQEPEHHKEFAQQSNLVCSDHEEKSIEELAIKEHVQDAAESRHAYIVDEKHDISKGFIVDEQTLYEETDDVKEMDEALLSELDAVGDFRVLDMVPSMDSMTYSTAVVDCNDLEEIIDEVQLRNEMPFDQGTSLSYTIVQKAESDRDISETLVAETKDPNLVSHTENVITDLLVLEAQPVDGIDARSMKVGETAQNFVVGEPVEADFLRKEEDCFPETELLFTDSELSGCASGVGNFVADVAINRSESSPHRIQFEHSLREGHDKSETCSKIALPNAEIMEQSGENAEKVVDRAHNCKAEALNAAAESEVGFMEFEASLKEKEIKVIEKTPLIAGSTTEVAELRDDTDGICSMEYDLFQGDRDVEAIDNVPFVEASTAPVLEHKDQAEGGCSIELELFQIDSGTKQKDIIPDASAVPVIEPKNQTGCVDSMELESSKIDKDTKEIDTTPLIEESTTAAQPIAETEVVGSIKSDSSRKYVDDKEVGQASLVEVSSEPALQPTNLFEGVGFMELKSLHTAGNSEVINIKTFVEASTGPAIEPRDQTGVGSMDFESLQVHSDITEIHEPLVLESSNSVAVRSEYGRETLKMPVAGARIASDNQNTRNTSEPLLLGKDSIRTQEFLLDRYSIDDKMQIDREVTQTPVFPSHEDIIAPASESEIQKGKIGSSESLQLDANIHTVQESPTAESGFLSALETEEEEQVVEYPEAQPPLQVNRVIEHLQDWHVVEESDPHVIGSEGRIQREAATESESLQIHTDMIEIKNSPASQASMVSASIYEDQTVRANHEESGPLLIDRRLEELEELPVVKARDALAFESEGQLKRTGPVEPQQGQMDGDSKEIHDVLAQETCYASGFRPKDEKAIN